MYGINSFLKKDIDFVFNVFVLCVDEPLLVLGVCLQLHDHVVLHVAGQTLDIDGLIYRKIDG